MTPDAWLANRRAQQQQVRERREQQRLAEQTPEQFERTTLGLGVTRSPADSERATIAIRPKLNGLNLRPFQHRVRDLTAQGVRVLTIDLAGYTAYLDRTTLGCFVAIRNELARVGGRVVLSGATPANRAMLEQEQLDHLFEVR